MKLEVWSDVVCPWCYIGKRRLEKALAGYEHAADVEMTWRSFQLDPSARPGDNVPKSKALAAKYGVSPVEAKAMIDRVTAVAAQEGLTYHLEKAVTANTFDAHRLTHFAATRNLADALHERLFRAALVDGDAVDDADTLVRIATDVGLPADATYEVLNGIAYTEDVREDIDQGAALGVTGVPFFVFDRTYGISGAQPVETFLATLHKAADTTA